MNSSDGAGHMIDMEPSKSTSIANRAVGPLHIAIVTSIHRDFDARLWKSALSLVKMGFGVTLICPWCLPDGAWFEGVYFRTFTRPTGRSERWKIPARLFQHLFPELIDKNRHRPFP